MSQRSKLWAVRARAKLVYQLGGKCVQCGTKGSRKNGLQLDHIYPAHWEANRLGSDQRIKVYREALQHGNLQVLCRNCNEMKGDRK